MSNPSISPFMYPPQKKKTLSPLKRQLLLLVLTIAGCVAAGIFYHQCINFAWIRRQWSSPVFRASVEVPESATTPSLLLVSCFFPLKSSKHSLGQYGDWMKQFLQQVESPLYIFSTPEMADLLHSYRPAHLPPMYVNTSFTAVLEQMPHFHHPSTINAYKTTQIELDEEGFRHNADLYAIWNGKLYMTQTVALHSKIPYDYYLWVDMGTFRDRQVYRKWPDPRQLHRLFLEGAIQTGRPTDELVLQTAVLNLASKYKHWTLTDGPIPQDFLMGGFFAGSAKAIDWYAETFYHWHDIWMQERKFVGKDQSLFNTIAISHPDRFISHNPMDRAMTCGNRWWFWQYMIASDAEREEATSWWSRIPFLWFGSPQQCRPLPIYSMNQLLVSAPFVFGAFMSQLSRQNVDESMVNNE